MPAPVTLHLITSQLGERRCCEICGRSASGVPFVYTDDRDRFYRVSILDLRALGFIRCEGTFGEGMTPSYPPPPDEELS
jgi:hypothetical protein